MDVLNVLDKLDQIEILFEPIYSADEHSVAAYEVLGQLDENINLTMFSASEEIPEEIRAEIEQLIIRESLQIVGDKINDVDLYIPCNPNLLMLDFGESYFTLLKEMLPEQLLSKLVLVISEHHYKGNIEQLHHVVKYMKTYGIKIALDDIGAHSNLNHILLLEPYVLKMKVEQLDYNHWSAQNHVFSTLRALALKIGASLLVSNVDAVYQLQHGWKNGARYYKGVYLEPPLKEFIARDTLKSRFHDECKQFIMTEKKLLEQKYEATKMLERKIIAAVEQVEPTSTNIDSLLQLAEKLRPYIFRLYICDGEGFQTTPNIMLIEGNWRIQQDAIHKNWSWRPYFLQNLIKMRHDGQSKFSETYSDIETAELTRTYSMALPQNEYLFMDVSYDYLYENNIVS
ncbi:EAL-associated domain-containing protein [Metasolibacillus sp. FSL H7-0170]|uniref:EAL-associated domain-containing protein n=1 Tax=Metasolibacillus TaxID=2703677 RepID=UPI000794F861|nr:EAL-associated domain-containing protein [Metasolibacillus fluoroglycofenilyticus]KYG90444.1 diguanylate phosphodiesterase [[Bacillus] sp. KCTC 13219]